MAQGDEALARLQRCKMANGITTRGRSKRRTRDRGEKRSRPWRVCTGRADMGMSEGARAGVRGRYTGGKGYAEAFARRSSISTTRRVAAPEDHA
jgi:hypothetical protein